jgi:hypothetical protein
MVQEHNPLAEGVRRETAIAVGLMAPGEIRQAKDVLRRDVYRNFP